MKNLPENFKIPNNFTLLGHKYQVQLISDLFETEEIYGDEDDDRKLIRIQGEADVKLEHSSKNGKTIIDYHINKARVIETFFHEAFHAILDSVGESKLSCNERFVSVVAKAMLELYLSAEYEETKQNDQIGSSSATSKDKCGDGEICQSK